MKGKLKYISNLAMAHSWIIFLKDLGIYLTFDKIPPTNHFTNHFYRALFVSNLSFKFYVEDTLDCCY